MKLKRWVEVVLYIIALTSGIATMYNVEISVIPLLIAAPIFITSVALIEEYGTIGRKEYKNPHLLRKGK